MHPSSPSSSSQPPMAPSSARGSALRPKSALSAGAFTSAREAHVSERRASHSLLRETPYSSVPRSHRGGSELETPTRTRAGAISSARRSTLDLVQTQGNAMKVYVRVRPFSERELAQQGMSTHSTVRIDAENPGMITVLDPNRDFRPIVTYKFTRCFWSVFERTNDDLKGDKTMADMRDTVDTYLNGGMNSARRARAQSFVSQEKLVSGRGKAGGKDAAESAPTYLGSGSNAAMAETNVSHPPYASQGEVYKQVGKPILDNTLEGYNGCVFAYGQTGSGKTFTMMGYAPAPAEFRRRRESLAPPSARHADVSGGTSPHQASAAAGGLDMPSFASQSTAFDRNDSPDVLPLEEESGEDVVNKAGMDPIELMGIIPRTCTDLFAGLRAKREQDASWSYRVEVTYYEIYNEKVYDLIKSARSSELKIRNHPTMGPYVDGLAVKTCNKEEDVMRVIRLGIQERHTAQTKFNNFSSRSHAILSFNILQLSLDGSDNTMKMQSKLNLVDLAGSERAGAAGADRPEYKEGVNINLSLTVLGRVIDCLADLSQNRALSVPVPYRDSTLTLLLMDSLGGNSQTSMVATVSPHAINFEEVKQTLRYASRAAVIVNRAVINEDPLMRQIKQLTGEVDRLQRIVNESGACNYTNEDIRAMEKKIKMLERKVAEQERVIAGLRAELERAGIADPTLEESFAEGAMLRTAQEAKREEQMMKKYETMLAELSTARAELERRSKGDLEALAALKKLSAKQGARIAQLELESKAACRLGMLYSDRTLTDLAKVFSYIEEKENSFFQNCWTAMLNTNSEASAVVTRMKREVEDRQRELHRQYDSDLAEQEQRFQKRLREIQEENSAQQQAMLTKHRDALAAIEEHMQRNRDIHAEECRQLTAEKEQLRRHGAEATAKAREAYQQDLEKLRKKLESEAGDRHGGADSRDLLYQNAREMERLRDELERLKAGKERESSRLRDQMTNEQMQHKNELREKDFQRRQLDNELSDLRRQLLAMRSERNRMEQEYKDQIGDLLRQQEELISISKSVLGDWENKSSDMEGQMCKLRALTYDKDYMNFRQKMRELAFSERMDITKELTGIEEKKRRDAEALNRIRDKVRRTVEEQESAYNKFRQHVLAGPGTPRPEHADPTPAPSPFPKNAGTGGGARNSGGTAIASNGSASREASTDVNERQATAKKTKIQAAA